MSESNERDDLLTTLQAATRGDLTARAKTALGPLADIAASVNDMLAALEKRAAQISYAATSVAITAEAISGALPEISEGMSRQQSAVSEIARKLKALEARSEEIGQIVDLLDDVTSETNILSLNAAIEASRAGAQGKGFGLVAEEVRKMAERAASASKDIGAYIETIASATGDATRSIESVRNVADQLSGLTTRASNEAAALTDVRQSLVSAISQLRFAGQGESEITRILRARRDDLARVLSPLVPLLASDRTPLGEALRNLLAALGKQPSDS